MRRTTEAISTFWQNYVRCDVDGVPGTKPKRRRSKWKHTHTHRRKRKIRRKTKPFLAHCSRFFTTREGVSVSARLFLAHA